MKVTGMSFGKSVRPSHTASPMLCVVTCRPFSGGDQSPSAALGEHGSHPREPATRRRVAGSLGVEADPSPWREAQ